MATVYNVMGSGKDAPPDGSSTWKEYWESNSQLAWPPDCQSGECPEPATEGGHVSEKQNAHISNAGQVYIAPLCARCNERLPSHAHPVPDPYLIAT